MIESIALVVLGLSLLICLSSPDPVPCYIHIPSPEEIKEMQAAQQKRQEFFDRVQHGTELRIIKGFYKGHKATLLDDPKAQEPLRIHLQNGNGTVQLNIDELEIIEND